MRALLLFGLLLSCGGETKIEYEGSHDGGWHPVLREIALDFAADAAERELPIPSLGQVKTLQVDDARVAEAQASREQGVKLLGVCLAWGRGRNYRGEVYIISGLEEDQDLLRRLVYHELTHCAYGLDHFGEDGDIMFPSLTTAIFGWEEARERLFAGIKERLCPSGTCSGRASLLESDSEAQPSGPPRVWEAAFPSASSPTHDRSRSRPANQQSE